jgi:hypothetical protein
MIGREEAPKAGVISIIAIIIEHKIIVLFESI